MEVMRSVDMVVTAQSTRRDLLISQKVDPVMEVPLSVETLQAAMPATSKHSNGAEGGAVDGGN